jgi:hypothetical protein
LPPIHDIPADTAMPKLLHSLNIVRNPDTQIEHVFLTLVPDFRQFAQTPPAEYVRFCLERFEAFKSKETQWTGGQERGMNGKYFETVLATLFFNRQLTPFFMGAKVAFVPDVIYDFIFYEPGRGPICVSAKTSLRERYKQADLEAMALKSVHRRAQSYLLTYDETRAVDLLNEKIRLGDMLGLDAVIHAQSPQLNEFVQNMTQRKFAVPESVPVVSAGQSVGLGKINLFASANRVRDNNSRLA